MKCERTGDYGPERGIGARVNAKWGAENPEAVANAGQGRSRDKPSYMLATHGSKNQQTLSADPGMNAGQEGNSPEDVAGAT